MTSTPAAPFTVRLTNFEGPFDLLLQLIARHKLDVTEIALSTVTDEFITHVRLGQVGEEPWDLDQTTSFIVVAATLLDLKAARLLPQGEVEDPEDLAILEARDLLFARLLQYRAFKQMAAIFQTTLDDEAGRWPRPGGLEDQFTSLLPEVEITIDVHQLAWLAARAERPREEPEVSLTHLHAPRVSVQEQAGILIGRLRRHGVLTFRAIAQDAADRLVVVARFLALLELAREQAVTFEQLTPLGELTIRWTGSDSEAIEISDEFDAAPQPENPGGTRD